MQKNEKSSRQRRFGLFGRILSSYFILVILLFNVVFYSQAYRRVDAYLLESQRLVLSQAADTLDRLFAEAVNTGRQILASSQVASLMYCRENDLNVYKKLGIMHLQEELIRRIAYNGSIESIAVLFTHSGVSASNTGILRGENGIQELSVRFGLSDDQLKNAYAAHQTLLSEQPGGQGRLTALVYDSVIRSNPDAVCLLSINCVAAGCVRPGDFSRFRACDHRRDPDPPDGRGRVFHAFERKRLSVPVRRAVRLPLEGGGRDRFGVF